MSTVVSSGSSETPIDTPETRHPQPVNPPAMSTIASKLKKYFGTSGQTIAEVIPAPEEKEDDDQEPVNKA